MNKLYCNYCEAEWSYPGNKSFKDCPFCGEPIPEPGYDVRKSELHDILLNIANQYGVNILCESRLIEILEDYEHNIKKKYQRIIRQAVDDRIGANILDLSGGDRSIIEERISAIKSKFKNDNGYDITADYIIDCFLYSLGMNDFIDKDQYYLKTQKNDEFVQSTNSDKGYSFSLDLASYKFPGIKLLDKYENPETSVNKDHLISIKNRIIETLEYYNIHLASITATIGPTVTLYEICLAEEESISRISDLEGDIILSLSELMVRVIVPVSETEPIGIEVPNPNPEVISLRSAICSIEFQEAEYQLPLILGKTISNKTYIKDLAQISNLLIAGAPKQGRSVLLDVIITSLLYKKHPAQLKFVLIGLNKERFENYSKIERHYLAKLPDTETAIIEEINDFGRIIDALTIEMEGRKNLFNHAQVRNVTQYNAKFKTSQLEPEEGHRYLPYIVVIINELADFTANNGQELETNLLNLCKSAHISGIHLVIATQRTTTKILTERIKGVLQNRIALKVTSMVDSRTILGIPDAKLLIGRGDMLFSIGKDIIRLQCPFIDSPEISRITEFIASQEGCQTAFLLPDYIIESNLETAEIDFENLDDFFDEAARLVVQHQNGSTSLIQKTLSIGYNRAGRLIDKLEVAGVVGPFEGRRARQVLIKDEISLEKLLSKLNSRENINKTSDNYVEEYIEFLKESSGENRDDIIKTYNSLRIPLKKRHFNELEDTINFLVFIIDNSEYSINEMGGRDYFRVIYDVKGNCILPFYVVPENEIDISHYLETNHASIYKHYEDIKAFTGCFSVTNLVDDGGGSWVLSFHQTLENTEGNIEEDLVMQIENYITPEALYNFIKDVLSHFE